MDDAAEFGGETFFDVIIILWLCKEEDEDKD